MSAGAESGRPALARGVRKQVDKVTGRDVLLHPEGVIELNDTGCAILEQCDGVRTVDEVIQVLAESFEVEEAVLKTDVIEYLADLHRRGLVIYQP